MESDASPIALTARQVPQLRRELIEFTAGPTARMVCEHAIRTGKQSLQPAMPPTEAADYLVRLEHERLLAADLYYLDGDLCELTNQAEPGMPDWVPDWSDLPSRSGYVVLGSPATPQVASPVYAISWGPVDAAPLLPFQVRSRTLPCIMLTVYTVSPPWLEPHASNPDFKQARAEFPLLNADNECVVPIDWEGEVVPIGHLPKALSWYGRWLYCAFRLAAQGGLTEDETVAVPRPERKRHEKAGIAAPASVRITRLRQTHREPATSESGGGREYRHRWIVRGHWRNQWYPSVEAHRPKYIVPHPKGPKGAPLIGGEKVTIVAPPPPTKS